MSATPTLTDAEFAAAELAYRAIPKAERTGRTVPVPAHIMGLGGAALRALAGDLGAGITTQVEAKIAASAASKAAKASAPKAPAAPKGTNPNTTQVTAAATAKLVAAAQTAQMPEKLAWDFAAKALKAAGYPVPRHIAKAAKVGTLAPKA